MRAGAGLCPRQPPKSFASYSDCEFPARPTDPECLTELPGFGSVATQQNAGLARVSDYTDPWYSDISRAAGPARITDTWCFTECSDSFHLSGLRAYTRGRAFSQPI
ncbi:unnamed protein product [Polarella glacialis]|uniref:Uncharacterized protein n=1 Tax=Polarella glacialis TaxID=89957 RepID=A0A813EN40_POLGL|nr:unnamed protein product [Polarella glacialis]